MDVASVSKIGCRRVARSLPLLMLLSTACAGSPLPPPRRPLVATAVDPALKQTPPAATELAWTPPPVRAGELASGDQWAVVEVASPTVVVAYAAPGLARMRASADAWLSAAVLQRLLRRSLVRQGLPAVASVTPATSAMVFALETQPQYLDRALGLLRRFLLSEPDPAVLARARSRVQQPSYLLGAAAQLRARALRALYIDYEFSLAPSEVIDRLRQLGPEFLPAAHKVARDQAGLWLAAGPIRTDEIAARLADLHQGAPRKQPVTPAVAEPQAFAPGATIPVLDLPTPQVFIFGAYPGPTRGHPDAAAFDVASHMAVLSSSSTLRSLLRQGMGATYDLHATYRRTRGTGTLLVLAPVKPDLVLQALSEMRALGRAVTQAGPGRIAQAKRSARERWRKRWEAPSSAVHALAELWGEGRPAAEWLSYGDAIDQVREADIARMAGQHLDPRKAAFVLMGSSTDVALQLMFSPYKVQYEQVDWPPRSIRTSKVDTGS